MESKTFLIPKFSFKNSEGKEVCFLSRESVVRAYEEDYPGDVLLYGGDSFKLFRIDEKRSFRFTGVTSLVLLTYCCLIVISCYTEQSCSCEHCNKPTFFIFHDEPKYWQTNCKRMISWNNIDQATSSVSANKVLSMIKLLDLFFNVDFECVLGMSTMICNGIDKTLLMHNIMNLPHCLLNTCFFLAEAFSYKCLK